MKKIFILAAFIAVIMVSCTDKKSEETTTTTDTTVVKNVDTVVTKTSVTVEADTLTQ